MRPTVLSMRARRKRFLREVEAKIPKFTLTLTSSGRPLPANMSSGTDGPEPRAWIPPLRAAPGDFILCCLWGRDVEGVKLGVI